jgi:hypothetical protein
MIAAAGPCAAADPDPDPDPGFAVHLLSVLKGKPDWLNEQPRSGFDRDDVSPSLVIDSMQLVVQQDRRDGTDLLTVRYPLLALGELRAYAGAGLNQAVYFAETSDIAPTYLSRRNRHHSLGAAAELGAAWRMGKQVMVSGDLRWVDLARQADMLRTPDGLTSADELSVGVSVGWRFH